MARGLERRHESVYASGPRRAQEAVAVTTSRRHLRSGARRGMLAIPAFPLARCRMGTHGRGLQPLVVEVLGAWARNRHVALALGLTALLAPAPGAFAQRPALPDAVRAAADGIEADQLARDLAFLSSDALLGRNTPSAGFDSAAAYIARRLARAGLTPLGDAGGFFQYYDLREQRVDTAAAFLEIGGRRFRFGDDFIIQSFAGPLFGTFPV